MARKKKRCPKGRVRRGAVCVRKGKARKGRKKTAKRRKSTAKRKRRMRAGCVLTCPENHVITSYNPLTGKKFKKPRCASKATGKTRAAKMRCGTAGGSVVVR